MADKHLTELDKRFRQWALCAISCHECANRSLECHVFNCNIEEVADFAGEYKIRPTTGYVGDRYLEQEVKILLLGKNPGGGDRPDDLYFRCLERLQTGRSAMRSIQRNVCCLASGWSVIRLLNLEKTLCRAPQEIAYSNQILCRTQEAAISKLEKGNLAELKKLYRTCVRRHLLGLLEILKPDVIIAMGKKTSRGLSWDECLLKPALSKTPFASRVRGLRHPGRGGALAEAAREDLRRIAKEFRLC